MNAEIATQDAFVLTGSGANAAYEVGVMKALLRERWGVEKRPPIDPYCYSGTSVGALNAAVMVSLADRSANEAVEFLENLWMDRIAVKSASSATGLFRVRAEPTQYLNVDSYVSNPLKPVFEMSADMLHFARKSIQRVAFAIASAQTLPDGAVLISEVNEWLDLSPLVGLVSEAVDVAKIAASSKKLRITAVNWETGTPRTFGNSDLDKDGAHQAILAALALPGVVPSQHVDGLPFVDGAFLMHTPLKPAIEARDKESDFKVVLHTVFLDANVARVPLPVLSNTFATVYRLYILALSRWVNADIDRVQDTNDRIHARRMLAAFGKEDGAAAGNLNEEAADMLSRLEAETKGRVELTVHRYRPSKNIHGFELRQFEKDRVKGLIQHGYEDAIRHDCEESGCIPRKKRKPTGPPPSF